MTGTIQKWGNSLALRIPSSLAKDAGLTRGAAVELAIEDGRIVVKPKARRRYSLSRLLKGVRKDNLHGEHDWGAPTGRESW